MAFTAGSPELAHALKLAAQLAAVYSTYNTQVSVQGLTNSGNYWGLADSYASDLGFAVTGYTTGNGFPPFGTKSEDGLTHGTNGTAATGTTLGANTGLTVGIYFTKLVRADRPNAGATFESYPSTNNSLFPGRTAAIYFGGGGTGSIS